MASGNQDEPDPTSKLRKGLSATFTSGVFSDLRIHCKGSEWNVHKVVVCAQSDFFNRACVLDFKEKKENLINLREDDPNIVHAMLEYLYKFEYHGHRQGPTDPGSVMSFHVDVYIIAEKYGLSHLKAYALKMAKGGFNYNQLDPKSFAPIVSAIYDGTPDSDRGMRDFICKVAATRLCDLLLCDEFKDLIRNNGDFSIDLLGTFALPSAASRKEKARKGNVEAPYNWFPEFRT
ncbi:uncharacterized protein K452DRAFT_311888 [Aplosporella prunicola CBS 121167]|uniref:BTB domain-containing protein n=1 Tax=Aplosporella prunicola CBS 121167 TaxID=1176127 RepID=A0A6A6B4C6_9PEZI|nr:uncharacterized protein K452DRAFT_311888 [Aplosporella prunicola CBS 121167]KAF2138115.1 hypothetical protein K452DRAFT_311888 [Aplosporella prunicola CBS 121167]